MSLKNVMYEKKIIFRILLHGSCKNGKYLGSIMDESAITCDDIIDEDAAKSNNKAKSNDKRNKNIPLPILMKKIIQTFYILLTFLSVTIALLIAV